ncbi:MAG: hypothetical protein Q8R30_02310 [bacterium]|nr:hypothetical protein [bacterium]MDZ4285383.1 hypothetical protein [Candidatus Sungbacteria bacterium]
MGFFSRYAQKKAFIVIDLGSHSIKTAIFEKPKIGPAPVNIKKTITRISAVSRGSRVFASLHDTLTELFKIVPNPQKIVIGIGPNVADISLQKWTVDSLHFRETLTIAHIQKYFQQLFNEHREEGHAFLGYPASIEINGYPVDIHNVILRDPSTVKEITLRAIMLRFSDEVGSAFGELRSMFGGIEIEYIPLQAVAAEVITLTHKIQDGLLIDVGGLATTLMFIRGGCLNHVASFPIGTNRFSHSIMKRRGGKFVEAEDTRRQYAQGLLSEKEQAELSHMFTEETEVWKRTFVTALEAYYPLAPLPQNFYLYGGGSYLPEVRSALWARDVIKGFSPFESPSVHMIQAPQIFNSELQGVVEGAEDVGLAALMYYSLNHTPLF